MSKGNSFTVIIPCYCDGAYAIEAIQSALEQKDVFPEIIFVDDGSTDDSYELVANKYSWNENVSCYKIENSGVSCARNFGFSKSRGDWIVFLDSDDLLAEDYLASVLRHLESQPEKRDDVMVMPFSYFGMPNSARAKWVLKYRPPMLGSSRFFNLFKLSVTNCFPISSAIVSRKLQQHGKFFNESLSHYEDWELWLRLAKRGVRFSYLNPASKAATLIRIREGVSSNSSRMMEARKSIARNYFGGSVMAFWQFPVIGNSARKSFVGFWRLLLRKNPKHPNLTGI